ncbi:MAG: diguanylate cyclase [Desulfobia sp.]
MDFIHHLPQGTLLLREDSTILQTNQLASDLLKYEISDLIGKKLSSFFTSSSRSSFLSFFQELPSKQAVRWTTDFFCGDESRQKITLHLSRLPGNTVIAQLQEEGEPERNRKSTPDSKLKLLEAQYRHASTGIMFINGKREIVYYNKEFLKIWDITSFGKQCRDIGKALFPLLPKLKNPENFLEKFEQFCEPSDKTTSDEVEFTDGRVFNRNSFPIYNRDQYLGRLWHFTDVTEFKKINKIFDRQQKFLSAVLENIQDGIIACDEDYKLTFFNQAGRKLHGLDEDTFTSMKWTEKYHLYKEDGITPIPTEKQPLFRVLRGEKICNEEMVIKTAESEEHSLRVSGRAIYDNGNDKPGAVISLHDITDLKKAQQKLQHMAYHDSLTGLPNRRLFHILLNQAVSQAQRNMNKVAVCFFDLDNFKQVNDRLGHNAGDKMLIKVTQIVRKCLRASDLICRWGGDEFVVALPQISHSEDAGLIAGKMCQAIEQEIADIYPDFSVTTSMGIALYPDHASHPDNLIRAADIAMYLAKQKGKNRFNLIASEFIPDDYE